jgi:hypothetical protein
MLMSREVSWNLQLTVRDGQLDTVRALMGEMVASTLEESGALGYEWYLGEDGTTCHIHERYTDSEAALAHAGNFGSLFAERFFACFEPTCLSVYGRPTAEVRAALDPLGASYYGPLGGFSR